MRSNVSGGIHGSEYRRFNRSFGRGNSKPYQRHASPPPRTRRGDLFVEAGRLAVEYLVSHGILSSNVLSSKSHNGLVRSNSGEFETRRTSQDRDIAKSSVDGISGRRKSPNDEDPSLSRSSYVRDRRRNEASRGSTEERGNENEREGSLPLKANVVEGIEADAKETIKDVCDSRPAESASNDEKRGELQDEIGKPVSCDDPDSKVASVPLDKDVKEVPQPSDIVDGASELNKGKETLKDEMVERNEENDGASKRVCTDLVKLCPSEQIPTAHTSLANKSPRSDSVVLSDDGNAGSDTGHDSVKSTKDITMNDSSEIPSSNENCSLSNVGVGQSEHPFEDAGVLDSGAPEQKKSVETLSFGDATFSYDQKSNGLAETGNCSKDRGEKRNFEVENMGVGEGEGAKRAKHWLSVAPSDEYSQLSDLSEKQSISQANRTSPLNIFTDCANQENFTGVALPLKGSVGPTIESGEEKQLFSGSFKICDLNLMEASDMRDTRDVSGLLYPTMSGPNKNPPVDVDLSMNNNYSFTGGYNAHGAPRKDIEVIDLEMSSLEEVRNLDSSTGNMEGGISNMGDFPNNSQNSHDNPDGQDGYGFMISELLGNDVPNCSSVQSDINSLHSDIGLHHGEGIFSEDDQIYMSLGEIPISILRGWEQPTQERNPFEM